MIPARSFVLSVVNKVSAYRILRKNIENTIRKKWEHNYMKKKKTGSFTSRVFPGHRGCYSLEQLHHLFQSYVS